MVDVGMGIPEYTLESTSDLHSRAATIADGGRESEFVQTCTR